MWQIGQETTDSRDYRARAPRAKLCPNRSLGSGRTWLESPGRATIAGELATQPEKPDDAEARLGARLGNYVLQSVIGRGGMGVVYRAEHLYIHKPAAVKVMHRHYFDHPDARQRFLREAQTASVIDHPNIVGINDFGEAPDGTVFLVMAHVEGVGLDQVLREQGKVPLFRALGILGQVTAALGAAHGKGVVHRDLKPENIMLATRPGRRQIVRQVPDHDGRASEIVEHEAAFDFVTLLDFGAAKFWHQSAGPLGESGTVVGTPGYMAPETARRGVADERSDIYSVGVVFYEMLTGSVPFEGKGSVEIMVKHVNAPVEPPRIRNPNAEITPEAERVIMRALEKDPARRYATMEEMGADLQSCFGSIRFSRPGRPPPAGASFEALRKQGPLLLDKVKRRPTPPASGIGGKPPSAERPVLLVKRKSGRYEAVRLAPSGSAAAPGAPPAESEDEGEGS